MYLFLVFKDFNCGMTKSEKYLVGISALIIALFSALGFYLIEGAPKIKSLVASGHNHMLSFAFGAVLFALVLSKLNVGGGVKKWLSIWMVLTFLGPLALIYAGFTGNTGMLQFTSPLFMGSFVLLWLWLAYAVFSQTSIQ